jgi:hypothetical protein
MSSVALPCLDGRRKEGDCVLIACVQLSRPSRLMAVGRVAADGRH